MHSQTPGFSPLKPCPGLGAGGTAEIIPRHTLQFATSSSPSSFKQQTIPNDLTHLVKTPTSVAIKQMWSYKSV
jgi:hypothetical protein